MAKEITMPKLSDTMTEGLFAGWRKNVGDRIERGDIIAEVETDKAVMELEAFASGVLLKTMAKDGEQVPVGTVLGLIGEPGELDDTAVAAPESAPAATAPTAAVVEPPPAAPTAPQPAAVHPEQEHEKASPMVRRLARDQGIDLGQVHGSGPEGRITQEDLAGYAAQKGLQQAEHTAAPQPSGAEPQQPVPAVTAVTAATVEPAAPATPQPISSMRQAIAAAVTHSWQTIPHFSVTVEIDMEACREVVSELKTGTHPVGYNALLIKACASALERFPLLQGSCAASRDGIHISFAVALPDGLMMPVIRRCDRLSVTEIENESKRLIEKCRGGKLSSEEMSGGCFSVSNLGMFGVDEFNALIMPGQTAILAVGTVTERPVVRDGRVIAAATMRVTLSSDHRSVDGAYAARFLSDLRSILEKPVSLLV